MAQLKRPEFAPEVDPHVTVERQKTGNIAQPEDRVKTQSHSRELPFLLDGDFLLVTNVSEPRDEVQRIDGKLVEVHIPAQTYNFRWNRKGYVIAPGEQKHVMFEALVDSLGDPRSEEQAVKRYNDGNESRGIIMERHSELSRGFARYAIANESLDELQKHAPHVSCETLNGVRVPFPFQRPDMLPLPVPQVDERKIDVDSKQITDRLAAENDDIREQLRITNERMDKLLSDREGVSQD